MNCIQLLLCRLLEQQLDYFTVIRHNSYIIYFVRLTFVEELKVPAKTADIL